MLSNRIIVSVSVAASLALIGLAIAANDPAPPAPPASGAAGNAPPGPPAEAVAACKGKAEGASVSFTGRGDETLTGTCQTTGSVLAARPTGGMGGAGQRPPAPR